MTHCGTGLIVVLSSHVIVSDDKIIARTARWYVRTTLKLNTYQKYGSVRPI